MAEAMPTAITAIGPLEHEHFRSERFQARLITAMAVVRNALNTARNPYIAISGGKDSLVVAALAEAVAGDTVTLHWTDDELEYPETLQWMEWAKREAGDRLIVTLGRSEHAGWFTPWRSKPFWRDPLPGSQRKTISADNWMARRGHDLTLLGTRAGESNQRRTWLLHVRAEHGPAGIYPVSGGTGRRCCPIWDWTDDDVWALIAGWQLPYNTAYDRLAQIGIGRRQRRIGPLPLTPRQTLADGWPDTLSRLEERYGAHWHD